MSISYTCELCNQNFKDTPSSKRRFCSRPCKEKWQFSDPKRHPGYKGGSINEYGYKQIRVNGKRVLEHRYVIEQYLSRKLSYDEIVHHKNHDKLDNQLENLMVMSRSEHNKIHNTYKHRDERNRFVASKLNSL